MHLHIVTAISKWQRSNKTHPQGSKVPRHPTLPQFTAVTNRTGTVPYTLSCHFYTFYLHFINKNNVFDGRSPLLWCNLRTQQCNITAPLTTSQCFFYCINANLKEDDSNLGSTGSKTLKVCSKHLRPKFCRWFVICRTYSGQPSGSKTDNYSQPSSIVILLGNYLLFLSSIPSHHMSYQLLKLILIFKTFVNV